MNLIERLRAEHARNGGQGAYAWSSRELCGKAATEIERLTAQVEAMREALEPFAKAADIKLCGEWRDDEHFSQTDVGYHLRFGHLRNARAALSYRGGD